MSPGPATHSGAAASGGMSPEPATHPGAGSSGDTPPPTKTTSKSAQPKLQAEPKANPKPQPVPPPEPPPPLEPPSKKRRSAAVTSKVGPSDLQLTSKAGPPKLQPESKAMPKPMAEPPPPPRPPPPPPPAHQGESEESAEDLERRLQHLKQQLMKSSLARPLAKSLPSERSIKWSKGEGANTTIPTWPIPVQSSLRNH